MILRVLTVMVCASFSFQSTHAMLSLFSSKKAPQPVLHEVVSFLEDHEKLLASSEFKKFMKDDVDAAQAMDFLNNQVENCPELMEERFGKVISSQGWFGRLVNIGTSKLGVNMFMVQGMLREQSAVVNVFAKVCERPEDKKVIPIKEMLDQELQKTIVDKQVLLRGVGRFATGKLLQCIHTHMIQVPKIIISEMVEKKTTKQGPDEGKEETEEQSHPWLASIVKKILEQCTKDSEGWKNCFGDMTVEAYKKKE